MRRRSPLRWLALAPMFAACATARPPALGGLDPVLLCEGEQCQGDQRLLVDFEGQTYRFAEVESQARFLVEPRRWAIQLGGACARMGASSGPGDAQRWSVHDGRLYVFASDACRDGFVADPDACLFVATAPPPEGAAGEAATAWRRADGVHGRFGATCSWSTQHRDGATLVDRRLAIARGSRDHIDAVRVDTEYRLGDRAWRCSHAIDGARGAFVDDGVPRAMYEPARRELLRELHRDPLVALNSPTVHLRAGGARRVAELDVREVESWYDGESVAFGIDAEHRVRTARFRGRGRDLRYCEVVRRYDGFESVDGLLVATIVRTWFDGVEQTAAVELRKDFAVDAAAAPGHFAATAQRR